MNYIVNKQQLRELMQDILSRGHDAYIPELLMNFLKSKQPVELIASGEFDRVDNNWGSGFIGEDNLVQKFDKYQGKNIRIFIERINNE